MVPGSDSGLASYVLGRIGSEKIDLLFISILLGCLEEHCRSGCSIDLLSLIGETERLKKTCESDLKDALDLKKRDVSNNLRQTLSFVLKACKTLSGPRGASAHHSIYYALTDQELSTVGVAINTAILYRAVVVHHHSSHREEQLSLRVSESHAWLSIAEEAGVLVHLDVQVDLFSCFLDLTQWDCMLELNRRGHLDTFPGALAALADLLCRLSLHGGSVSDDYSQIISDLTERAILLSRRHFGNTCYRPYYVRGKWEESHSMEKAAVLDFCNAINVVRHFAYDRGDEPLYDDMMELMSNAVPSLIRRLARCDGGASARVAGYYLVACDALCSWDEASARVNSKPVLHEVGFLLSGAVPSLIHRLARRDGGASARVAGYYLVACDALCSWDEASARVNAKPVLHEVGFWLSSAVPSLIHRLARRDGGASARVAGYYLVACDALCSWDEASARVNAKPVLHEKWAKSILSTLSHLWPSVRHLIRFDTGPALSSQSEQASGDDVIMIDSAIDTTENGSTELQSGAATKDLVLSANVWKFLSWMESENTHSTTIPPVLVSRSWSPGTKIQLKVEDPLERVDTVENRVSDNRLNGVDVRVSSSKMKSIAGLLETPGKTIFPAEVIRLHITAQM